MLTALLLFLSLFVPTDDGGLSPALERARDRYESGDTRGAIEEVEAVLERNP